MWDAHCHLDDPRILPVLPDVLKRARDAGIEGMIVAGVQPDRWKVQEALVSQEAGIYGAYGLHPWFVAACSPSEAKDALRALQDFFAASLASSHPAVGVGEIGLDHGKRFSPDTWGLQEVVFREQVALARALELPVILHVVRAYPEALAILKRDGLPSCGGMLHAFGGSAPIALEAQALGLHLSLGGSLTDPKASKLRKTAQVADTALLLVETDAPDFLPASLASLHPFNEPAFLPCVLQELAALRQATFASLALQTAQNTRSLFPRKNQTDVSRLFPRTP